MGIPARLLIHTCTYTAPAGGYDRDGEPIPGEPVTLDKVRLEPVNAIGAALHLATLAAGTKYTTSRRR